MNRPLTLLPGRSDVAAVRHRPGRNLLAGLTVAIVALPLALGFGVASGLGAEAGLVTAVVAGAVAAVFGGSNLQVSGPTGAMTVVLVPIVAQHGPGGVLTVGLLAGLILVAASLARLGRHIRHIPASVIEGFTIGIAAVIAVQQIPAALGVTVDGGHSVLATALDAVTTAAADPDWASIGVALAVAAVMLIGAHLAPGVPFSLIAVTAATITTILVGWPITPVGELPASLPAPSLAFIDLGAVGALAGAAIAVAALAALESLLSATVADRMAGLRDGHDPDRELFGQGLANIAAPMFGGVPATAAIARTAVNVRSGATSRLAAFSHAAILAGIMIAAAPLVARIPLAALAGVLIATAVRMIETRTVRVLARASRADALVMALTAAITIAVDLVAAVLCGLVAAGAFALRALSRTAAVTVRRDDDGVAIIVDGPLFFGAAHRFAPAVAECGDADAVVVDCARVTAIDGTGALALRDAVDAIEASGADVVVRGIPRRHRRAFEAVGVRDDDREPLPVP